MTKFASRFGRDLARGVSIAVVLALVVALFLWWLLVQGNERRYSAVFTGVVGLYEDNDVRILGVKVGHVDKVTPQGDTVRVDMLQKFTSTLATNDDAVNDFAEQAADASKFLADERGDLGEAVRQLGIALGLVQQFISDNRAHLKTNVDKLAGITQVLVDQRAALAETLDVAPVALSNIINSYNGSSGTLDARADLNELAQPPIVSVCNLVKQVTPDQLPQTLADACDQLKPIVQGLVPLPSLAEVLTAL